MVKNEAPDVNRARLLAIFVMVPFTLAVPPIVGWYIGSWLDKKFDTMPYLMFIFVLLGLIAGFREVYRMVNRFGNEE